MSYKHFTIEERCCLREYYKKGLSYRKIAELLGRNVSSVSRELRRNCTHMYDVPSYYPYTAQKKSTVPPLSSVRYATHTLLLSTKCRFRLNIHPLS